MLDEVKRIVLAAVAVAACRAAPSDVPLLDLSESFADWRAAFDAHRGEPRFLALLSPT